MNDSEIITNYDKVINMSVDELAEFCSVFQRCEFCSIPVNGVVEMDKCRKTTCKEAIKKWLGTEIKVN